jgi:hypothetical protein
MLMVNFEKLTIDHVEDFDTIDIILDWQPSFLDEKVYTFQKALTYKVENELDKHLLKRPVHFRFITRFDNVDLDLFVDNLINEVVKYMVENKRDREDRLGRPAEFDKLLMLDGTIMDCINNNLSMDVFNITILNKYDDEFFTITEQYQI